MPGKYGPPGKLFVFLIQKEPATMLGSETFSPFFNADIRTPCSLLMSLHLIAEEGRGGEDGCHAPGLGDELKMCCLKSPMWESEGEAWSEDESVSSRGSREGNVCKRCVARHRVVWAWWQDLSLLAEFGSWQRCL